MCRCSEEYQKCGKLLVSGGIEGVWELSVISAQFCCEPKTTPKNSCGVGSGLVWLLFNVGNDPNKENNCIDGNQHFDCFREYLWPKRNIPLF